MTAQGEYRSRQMKRKPRHIALRMRLEHHSIPTIDPGVVAKIVSEEGRAGIASRVASGMAGDEAMPEYDEGTMRHRQRKGLGGVVNLRETGEMIDSLGYRGRSLKNTVKEGRTLISWGQLIVKVGVGAKAKGEREVTRYHAATKYLAARSETQTVKVKHDIERKAILIQRWAHKHLGSASRDFMRIAQETKEKIARAISSDARTINAQKVQRKARAAERKARRAKAS